MKSTVLIATTSRWFPTARLGMALAKAGFTVEAVCSWRNPISVTSAVRRIYTYHGIAPLHSFSAAIAASHPTVIVPCDDIAILQLHALYDQERRRGDAGAAICSLIERSLGAPESFSIVSARTPFMHLAEEEGVRAPRTEIIGNASDLKSWENRMGFPAVLKSDGSWGGAGVRIVRSPSEAYRAFRTLQSPPLLARAAKRALIDRDMTLIWPSLLRTRHVVSAQSFVAGREATSTVACWKGSILASLHFEVLNKHDATGPATVMRLIENADMTNACEKMVKRLKLSGIVGFDFMLEAQSGNAHLVELNPRATQVGHLALGEGRDLTGALYAAVSGGIVQESPRVTENDTITLFPHEWLRNPDSPFIQSGYHDVPWEEADLIRVCVGTRQKQSALYSQRKEVQAFAPARVPRQ
jgi:carbamoyl-phosphate synthase L subunit-like protein